MNTTSRDRLAVAASTATARTAALPPDSWEAIANAKDHLIDQLWRVVKTDAGQSGNDSIVDAVAEYKRKALICDHLLVALRDLVRDYELLLGDGITDSTAPPLLKDAYAAIAKAEGN